MLVSHPNRFIGAAACLIVFMAIVNVLLGSSISTPAERHFEFSYVAKIQTLTLESKFSFRDRASAATP
jgi:hypothetical protein